LSDHWFDHELTNSQELKQLREAAAAVGGPNYKPKFTFVVCAKRHNMRFFAANPADADRTGNLPAGTVVEKGVTHPYAFDFYRTSAAILQMTKLIDQFKPTLDCREQPNLPTSKSAGGVMS
jgi:hypothetical protein